MACDLKKPTSFLDRVAKSIKKTVGLFRARPLLTTTGYDGVAAKFFAHAEHRPHVGIPIVAPESRTPDAIFPLFIWVWSVILNNKKTYKRLRAIKLVP